MRETLRYGPDRLEILVGDASILEFSSVDEARHFLNQFKHDPALMTLWRDLAPGKTQKFDRRGAEEVLAAMAELLAQGQFRILKSRFARSRAAVDPAEKQAQSTGGPAPRKTSWIEFHLRDSGGQPVKGMPYRLKLPDASIQESVLDSFGHAEYFEISPGMCEIEFPSLEAGDWALESSSDS